MQEFITPIVKATKEGQKPLKFFTMKEYNDWYNNNNTEYKIKYYKGLGYSTSKEAKEYFNEINKLRLNFKYVNNEDDKSIELRFSKEETEARKNIFHKLVKIQIIQKVQHKMILMMKMIVKKEISEKKKIGII